MEEDIEELKKRKLAELQQRYALQQELLKQIEAEKQINLILKRLATPQAIERLKNVRLVNRALYLKAVQQIIALAQSGQLKEKISDEQMKKLLMLLSKKRETKIVRK